MGNKKKILFYFQQVGGANALLPLFGKLKSKYELIITGRKLVLENLKKRNIPITIPNRLCWNKKDKRAPFECFNELAPDLIITDTINLSRIPEAENCVDLWKLAAEEKIPSIAYVDSWGAYKERFSRHGKRVILPKKIAVIDAIMREDLISLGFPEEHITICGNPRFDELIRMRNGKSGFEVLHNMGLVKNFFLLAFISEPITRYQAPNALKKWGFTERTILPLLIKTLNSFPHKIKGKLILFVMFHPEDNEAALKRLINKSKPGFVIKYSSNEDSLKLISIADLVTGMSSILLLESVILQRLTISIQINAKQQDTLITNITHITKKITETAELCSELLKIINDKSYCAFLLEKQKEFNIIEDSCARWEHEINTIISP